MIFILPSWKKSAGTIFGDIVLIFKNDAYRCKQPSHKFADNYIKYRPYFFSLEWPVSNSRWSLYNENKTILLSLFKGMKYFELKWKDKIKTIAP